MAVLNLTLDSLKFANTDGFLRDFGTKKTRDQNGGSLTTRECNENVAKIFDTQRPFYVSEDSETSNIEFSATFVISNGVKLTLGEGSFPGVEVKILSGDNSAVITGQKEYILPLNGFTKFFWTGTSWSYTSFSPTQTSVASINSNDEFPIMQNGETKKVKFETLKNGVIRQVGDGHIFYRLWTSQEVSDVATLTSLLSDFPMGSLILFAVGWEGDTSNAMAGSSGYITIQGRSAYAFGCIRKYLFQNYNYTITWTDGLTEGKCSGWVKIS